MTLAFKGTSVEVTDIQFFSICVYNLSYSRHFAILELTFICNIRVRKLADSVPLALVEISLIGGKITNLSTMSMHKIIFVLTNV